MNDFIKGEMNEVSEQMNGNYFLIGLIIFMALMGLGVYALFMDTEHDKEMRKPCSKYVEKTFKAQTGTVYIHQTL